MNLTVEITGKTWGDLGEALAEVSRAVAKECITGYDANDTGRYFFLVEGEPEEEEELEEEDDGGWEGGDWEEV